MTFTKQPRSLPVIDKPDRENAESFPVQLVKTGNPTTAEINYGLTLIHGSLSNLYTKLRKLNAVLIQQKQEKGGNK